MQAADLVHGDVQGSDGLLGVQQLLEEYGAPDVFVGNLDRLVCGALAVQKDAEVGLKDWVHQAIQIREAISVGRAAGVVELVESPHRGHEIRVRVDLVTAYVGIATTFLVQEADRNIPWLDTHACASAGLVDQGPRNEICSCQRVDNLQPAGLVFFTWLHTGLHNASSEKNKIDGLRMCVHATPRAKVKHTCNNCGIQHLRHGHGQTLLQP